MDEIREGFRYAYSSIPIRSILLLLALVSLLGIPYVVLLPVFAKEILKGGPQTFGFLMTASGAGALVASLYLANRKNVLGLDRIIALSPAILGTSIIGFSLSRSLWLSLVMLVFAGFGMMMHIAASNTILQTVVEDDKRGRVMSLYTMSFMGMAPFGCILSGSLAGQVGVTATVIAEGICCLLGSLVFACRLRGFRKNVRPVYQKLGILPGFSTDTKDHDS